MNQQRLFLALIVLLFVVLGCNLPAEVIITPTPTVVSSPIQAQDIKTHTATPTIEIEITPTQTSEPPTPSGRVQQYHFPIGFTSASQDGSLITFHDLVGKSMGTVQTPGMSVTGDHSHVAGPFTGNPQDVPVVYLTFENMGDIKQSLNGQISTVYQGPDAASLRGAYGQNAYVYTTVTWSGSTLDSYFYLRTAYGGGASWVWERRDPESWAMKPLALMAENNEPQAIFYTLEPWGIGGDIVFPPRKGLFQLNLEHAENILHLTEEFNPIGLSLDNTVVAYTQVIGNIGAQSQSRITLYNLISGLMVPVDLAPESDRGGGYAVFSPDNQYVAWMEGAGWLMGENPTFHSRVRIANLDGLLLADIPDFDFAGAAGDPTATWAVPSGWLDGETLLVEVRGDDWNNPALVAIHFDGTGMTYLTHGKFLNLLFP